MKKIKEISVEDFEIVLEIQDDDIELHALIAIHNTSNGPALGGIRAYSYNSFGDALQDVLRLSKGMTYKSAIANIPTGGGKSVILKKKNQKLSKELLWSFAETVNLLNGKYICAEDIGISTKEIDIIAEKTKYVVGLDREGGSGDPSYYTAYGVFLSILETAKFLWNSSSLKGKKIAIQGLGYVGLKLAKLLFWQQASLIVSDINKEVTNFAKRYLGAQVVSVDEILFADCDILSPCAFGNIFSSKTIPLLNCKAIVGAANNQLETQLDGNLLMDKGILYAPDYLVNAGGLINVYGELLELGYTPQGSREGLNHIPQVLGEIFNISKKENCSTTIVADRIVEKKLFSLTN